MHVKNVLAGVAVADFESALAWYERLLGRRPDEQPMEQLADWHFPATGSIQLIGDADRAGSAQLTLAVEDLEKQVVLIQERGLTPGAIDDTTSDKVLFATIKDPDGNEITLVEERAATAAG